MIGPPYLSDSSSHHSAHPAVVMLVSLMGLRSPRLVPPSEAFALAFCLEHSFSGIIPLQILCKHQLLYRPFLSTLSKITISRTFHILLAYFIFLLSIPHYLKQCIFVTFLCCSSTPLYCILYAQIFVCFIFCCFSAPRTLSVIQKMLSKQSLTEQIHYFSKIKIHEPNFTVWYI